jgi:hypothetical protein
MTTKRAPVVTREKDATETDTDTEKIVMPARHFNALIDNKDTAYQHACFDAISASAKLKGEVEEKSAYKEALEIERREKEQLANRCQLYEKELATHRSKSKSTPQVQEMLKKMQASDEYLYKNKEALIEQYYKKNCAAKVDAVRKSLGLEIKSDVDV